MLIDSREKGGKGGREQDSTVREKHPPGAFHMQPGTEPPTQACVLTGNQTWNLSVCEAKSN